MTLNELEPAPGSQQARANWQILDFGKLPANTAFHVWMAWQVTRPTSAGMPRTWRSMTEGPS